MPDINSMSEFILKEYITELQKSYDEFKNQKLKLDMSRGKPCREQLNLSMGMLDVLTSDFDCKASDGTDCRNYGGLEGIIEARELFAEMLEVSPKEVIVSSNASLNIMYDLIARALILGVLDSDIPWGKLPSVKFLCPSPGYDRHFAICENLNIEMIPVEMKEDGPDMDAVEKLAGTDDSIKGIWCVPKYSNPDGVTYSDEVVDRLARMKTKAKDFRIFWDNAYVVHHFTKNGDRLKNIMTACKEAGNPNRVFIFSSTSKLTFPGSGVAVLAADEANLNYIKKQMMYQTIGPDKMNQLRHVKFLKSMENIEEHMQKHAAIMKPKFDMVLDILDKEFGGSKIAAWSKPNGGYFISLNTMPGCAKEIIAMAAEAGVTLTNAGAAFPYRKDPLDRNIRIAPSFPPLQELKKAIELLCICIKLTSARRVLSRKDVI